MCAVLAFIMRLEKSKSALVPLTAEQLIAARELREALMTDDHLARVSSAYYHGSSVAELDADVVDDDEEDDDDDDDDDDERGKGSDEIDPIPLSDGLPLAPLIPVEGLISSPMSQYWCPRIQQLLSQLLGTLFTQIPQGQDDKWFSPLLRFVVYSSRYKDGTYRPSGQLTQIIAAITFTGRIYFFSVIHSEVMRRLGVRHSS
jgi:hypothetical protein